MTNTIFQFIKICHHCKKIKIYKNEKQKLLKSMFIFDKYFQNIKINFITSLSKCKRHNRRFRHIMIIIDKLSKKKKYCHEFIENQRRRSNFHKMNLMRKKLFKNYCFKQKHSIRQLFLNSIV